MMKEDNNSNDHSGNSSNDINNSNLVAIDWSHYQPIIDKISVVNLSAMITQSTVKIYLCYLGRGKSGFCVLWSIFPNPLTIELFVAVNLSAMIT